MARTILTSSALEKNGDRRNAWQCADHLRTSSVSHVEINFADCVASAARISLRCRTMSSSTPSLFLVNIVCNSVNRLAFVDTVSNRSETARQSNVSNGFSVRQMWIFRAAASTALVRCSNSIRLRRSSASRDDILSRASVSATRCLAFVP